MSASSNAVVTAGTRRDPQVIQIVLTERLLQE
jgi:hypothetical protein